MYRSAKRRRAATGRGSSSLSPQRKRIIAVVGTLAVFGGVIAVTQISSAQDVRTEAAACPAGGADMTVTWQNDREVRHHWGDGEECDTDVTVNRGRNRDNNRNNNEVNNNEGEENEGEENEGEENEVVDLGILANNCNDSNLEPHDGFQNGNRCVSTAFGEVGVRNRNPTLLITESPEQVDVDQPFSFQVSTRNLVRDRFLAAGDGGYYVESSLLNDQGLVRGHFHSACRLLANEDEAPDPDPVPEFFVATEDGGGGEQPDSVDIEVAGLPTAGTYQCSSWSGDGSHRVPMMEAANQTPSFDSFRLQVN